MFLIEAGQSNRKPMDVWEQLAKEIAPFALTPEQLREAADPDQPHDVDDVGLPV